MQDNTAPKFSIILVENILRNFPNIDDTEGLKDEILQAIQEAISTEREQCAQIAESLDDGETANKPEYSIAEVATKLSLKSTAHHIARTIREQPEP